MLYGAVVRDLLLRLAIKDVIRPRWSSAILTELTNALRDRSDLDAAKTNRLAALMENSFPNARITFSDEDLARVPASVDSGDRHVVAAALSIAADAIVTQNRRHFPEPALSVLGIAVFSVDELLQRLLPDFKDAIQLTVADMADTYSRPPMTAGEVLDSLALHAPEAVQLLRW